uniref:BHLH domain-containing protein n=1 Tax=Salmo trutta TaxID=8032 RepID=A0A674D3F5_SALTR
MKKKIGNSNQNNTKSMKRMLKPVIEKKRRDRINQSLSELRILLLNYKLDSRLQNPKLEKAEILDLAVEYLQKRTDKRSISNGVPSPPAAAYSRSALPAIYTAGFQQCVSHLAGFMGSSSSPWEREGFILLQGLKSYIDSQCPTTNTSTAMYPSSQYPTTNTSTAMYPSSQYPTTNTSTAMYPSSQYPTTNTSTAMYPSSQYPTTNTSTAMYPSSQYPTTNTSTAMYPSSQYPTTNTSTAMYPSSQYPTTNTSTGQLQCPSSSSLTDIHLRSGGKEMAHWADMVPVREGCRPSKQRAVLCLRKSTLWTTHHSSCQPNGHSYPLTPDYLSPPLSPCLSCSSSVFTTPPPYSSFPCHFSFPPSLSPISSNPPSCSGSPSLHNVPSPPLGFSPTLPLASPPTLPLVPFPSHTSLWSPVPARRQELFINSTHWRPW